MAKCWTERGCDTAMQERCPHAADPDEKCPARCSYGQCARPQNAVPKDTLLFLEPNIDRSASMKEQCLYCEFFLTNGPKLS